MTLVSNLYLTHGLMLLCAIGSATLSAREGRGLVVPAWRVPAAGLLAVFSALSLIAYPTWGELRNPGLWMFAIVAGAAGVARGYWVQLDVDHGWRLLRLPHGFDGLLAACLLCVLAAIEIALALSGPADQPTTELGMAVLAAFLGGRAAAVLWRARHEPQSDLHDRPPPPVQE